MGHFDDASHDEWVKPTKRNHSWTTEVERNPDKRRSSSRLELEDQGQELRWLMEVRGLGALLMRATSDPTTGRLQFNGVATFTDDMLKFGLEAEIGAPRAL